MISETMVYRPRDPRANENGMVPRSIAEPLHKGDAAPFVMSDLADYRTVAADKETGKRVHIGGRRQHREFLKRNGYAEVGNDYVPPRREELSQAERVADIKRAIGE